MNLNQITVPSLDIPKSLAFYQALGLKLIVKSDHYARFECPDGNQLILFFAVENRLNPPWRIQ